MNLNKSKYKVYKLPLILCILIITISSVYLIKQNSSENIVTKLDGIANTSSTDFRSDQQLRFILNKGQAGIDAKFHVQGAGHTVVFYENKIVLRRDESETSKNEVVLQFDGAKQNPTVVGLEKLPGVAHFYKGQNSDQWQTNVPTFSSVLYKELYPGIDMGYIGNDGKLESEFYLSPGVDYHQIKLNYQGIKSKSIRDDGSLIIQTDLGKLIEKTPFAYQDINGVRNVIESEYVLLADASIGFELNTYNQAFPLVIDPELVFLTTIPSGVSSTWASSIHSGADGSFILAGSADRYFPSQDSIIGSNHNGGLGGSSSDGLIVKVDSTGTVIYSALFGGSRQDYFNDMAIDSTGSLHLTGFTKSVDFPLVNEIQDTINGSDDAFLVKISSSGVLNYSTYIGGSSGDWGEEVALDNSGNIYIAGTTVSADFPILGGYQTTFLGGTYEPNAFITKFDSTGTIIYSTYLGGTGGERVSGLEVDGLGQATIAGQTLSSDFPVFNAFQDTLGGVHWGVGDIYVTRLNSSGDGLIYSTYFGGSVQDWSNDLVLDSNGYAFIAGGTASLNFQVINGISSPEADSADGVLICLDNNGQAIYSLRTNILGYDEFNAIAILDSTGVYGVGDWKDSVRVYQTFGDSTLARLIAVEAVGHSIEAIHFENGILAFTGAYWPPFNSSVSSNDNFNNVQNNLSTSNTTLGKLDLATALVQFMAGWLVVHEKTGDFVLLTTGSSPEAIQVGANGNGKVTVNNQETEINADEQTGIKIENTTNQDVIIDADLVIPDDYTVLNNVAIITNDGSDELYLRTFALINYNLNLGAGADQIYLSLIADALSVLLNGGVGGDLYTFTREIPSGGGSAQRTMSHDSYATAASPITIIDSSGYDTLSFAGYDIGITLDLNLQNSAQTIDTSGTQIMLDGDFEVVVGTAFDDEITLSPLVDSTRHFNGGNGTDILNFVSPDGQSVDNGSTISTPGYADLTYTNIETVNISVATDIGDFISILPSKFSLGQNYPNPFNPSTTIEFYVPTKSNVTISIYNLIGQQIQQLVNQEYSAGSYSITWDGKSFNGNQTSSGIYFYRLETDNFVEDKKMILIK